ncbi:MAG: sn-glycerol-3-phosphate ABC transporter ATP-binding protein UgpC [bacterium]
MAGVAFQNVNKSFGDVHVVKDLNLEIADKEFLVLVGPSGCGKSTTLRMLAGLEEITSGEVSIGGRVINDVAPKDRNIAMVFQNYALYPHMTVYENMAFGLKLRKMPREEIDSRVRDAAGILGIDQLLKRRPRELSGGQRQRVAVGRAIVRRPDVFLFDEPLSNLDAKFRVQMRAELSKLYQTLQTTIVYVTHDQVEAMTMGSQIAIMNEGRLMQVGAPMDVYNKPKNKFVASFIGSPSMNFFDGVIEGGAFKCPAFTLQVPENNKPGAGSNSAKLILGIRPEDILDAKYASETVNAMKLTADVEVVEPLGAQTILNLSAGGANFTAVVDPRTAASPGRKTDLLFNCDKIHFFDGDSGAAI